MGSPTEPGAGPRDPLDSVPAALGLSVQRATPGFPSGSKLKLCCSCSYPLNQLFSPDGCWWAGAGFIVFSHSERLQAGTRHSHVQVPHWTWWLLSVNFMTLWDRCCGCFTNVNTSILVRKPKNVAYKQTSIILVLFFTLLSKDPNSCAWGVARWYSTCLTGVWSPETHKKKQSKTFVVIPIGLKSSWW